jgi:WD40 repeat protein
MDATTARLIGEPVMLNSSGFPRMQNHGRLEAFSPSGEFVLIANGINALLLETATSRPISLPLLGRGNTSSVAFTPDGRSALTANGESSGHNELWLWDLATRKPLCSISFKGVITDMSMSPDGRTIVLSHFGSSDTIELWDAVTSRQLGKPMQDHGFHALAVASPDGKSIVIQYEDRQVRYLGIPTPVAGEAEQIYLWTQLLANLRFGDNDTALPLDDDATVRIHEALDNLGGPPL